MSSFNFEDFAKISGLSDNTIKILNDEDLEHEDTLLLLDKEVIKQLKLPLGQSKRLVAGIDSLRKTKATASNQDPSGNEAIPDVTGE